MEDIDWPIESTQEDPADNIIPVQEPIIIHGSNDEITNNMPREPDLCIKMFSNRSLWDEMTCEFCHHCLSVGPFFYHPKDFYSACGRCVRNPASRVLGAQLKRDHLLEKLLPHLHFECSYGMCDAKLFSHQVEDHEENCTFKSEITMDPHELCNFHKTDADNYALTIPRELRDMLSCSSCKKPLSVFPVISNGELFICGRCRDPESGDWTEQSIYHMMAEYVEFPCANQGCTQLLKIDEVEEHEGICRWAHKMCPLCGESQKICEMPGHIRCKHWTDYKDHLKMEEQASLIKVEAEPYLVFVRAVENHLCCAVYGVDENKAPEKLQLEIVEHDTVLDSQSIDVGEIGQSIPENGLVRIEHAGKKTAFIRLLKSESTEGFPLDEEAKETLQCHVCRLYMTGLIFMCKNKHSMCASCKGKFQCCPMCRGMLDNDRNLKLENVAAKFKFPCQFQKATKCKVALIPKHLAKHEAVCRSRSAPPSISCIFPYCTIKLHSLEYTDFFDHCGQYHPNSVTYSGFTGVIKRSTRRNARIARDKVVFFDGESFAVDHRLCDEARLTFSVRQLGTTPRRYAFTVELNGNGVTTEGKGTCGVRRKAPEISIDITEHILDKRTSHKFKVVSYRLTLQEQTDYVDGDDSDNDSDDRDNDSDDSDNDSDGSDNDSDDSDNDSDDSDNDSSNFVDNEDADLQRQIWNSLTENVN